MLIVTLIWQKLSNIEREVTLIVTHFWQLFSHIFGQTELVSSSRYAHDILYLNRLSTSWRYDTTSQWDR